MSARERFDILHEAALIGRLGFIDLWYPAVEPNVNEIEIGLVDVRAADSLRLSYDFERDGWVIKQAVTIRDDAAGMNYEPEDGEEWREVAFVRSWGLERRT